MSTMERTFGEWVIYIVRHYGPQFLSGAGITMYISIIGTIVGLAIGLIIGVIRTIPTEYGMNPLKHGFLGFIKFILAAYVEIFRGTPMMVQAIVVYYGLQQAFNINLGHLTAGLLVVSINTGAYMAEIVRGGIQSIDKGQFEAASAVGMTHRQTMFSVVIPQTMRNILPMVGNEFVINIKDTSVLNVISVSELFFAARTVQGAIYRTFETYLVVAVIYFVLTFTVTRILKLIEKKMDGPKSYKLLDDSSLKTSKGVL